MPIVYISVGTNLGNKYKNIKTAINNLCSVGKIMDVSSIYLTSPLENVNQPDFYNCVVKIRTSLLPYKLLECLKFIEQVMGRKNKKKRYQPRTIDLDILFYGKQVIKDKNLVVPHPKLHTRKFVLWPMAEIVNGFVHPVLHKKISTLKKLLNDKFQKVKCVIPVKFLSKAIKK